MSEKKEYPFIPSWVFTEGGNAYNLNKITAVYRDSDEAWCVELNNGSTVFVEEEDFDEIITALKHNQELWEEIIKRDNERTTDA